MDHLNRKSVFAMGAVALMVAVALSTYCFLSTDDSSASGYNDSDSLTYELTAGDPWLLISGTGPMKAFSETDNLAKRYPSMCGVRISEGVTCISMYAFKGASNLVEVELPSTLEDIGSEAFANCSKLEWIDIPTRVSEIKYGTFEGCTSLGAVSFYPISIGYRAFADCSNLEDVSFGSSTGGRVTTILNDAFRNCTALKSIILGTKLSTLDQYAFRGCSNLSKVYDYSSLGVTAGSFGIPATATVLKFPVDLNVSDAAVVSGTFYSAPVAPDGYTVSVSGADWLTASGNTISGTPTTAGTYNITVSCNGQSAEFTIQVISKLAPTNSPQNGVIIMPS